MSEEALELVEEVEAVEEVVEEHSDEELQAMEHGWSPQDEWKGDSDDWVNAREFIKRGELFGKIKSLERDRDSMRKEFRQASTAMKDMLAKAKDTEYKRAMKNLKSQKREALDEGETSAVMDIDEEIEELKTSHQAEVAEMEQAITPPQAEVTPEFEAWKGKNQWYESDTNMQITADNIGMRFAQENPNANLNEVFAFVDKQIQKVYPEKFPKSRQRTDRVEAGTHGAKTGSKKSKYSEADLNDTQKTVMNTMVRTGVMTKAEYIKELARIGEIGG